MLAGLVPDVLDLYPEATVVGSKVALAYLKGLTHRPFKQLAVKGGEKVDLGQGHDIEFVMAPNLHWPDTMFSYDPATGNGRFTLLFHQACSTMYWYTTNLRTYLARVCGPVDYLGFYPQGGLGPGA